MRKDEALLMRCRAAKTVEEQNRCFDELAIFLETIEATSIDKSHGANNYEGAIEILAMRETISRSVLTTWPYGHASTCIDRVLDACGTMVSVSTCSSLLKEIAAYNPSHRYEDQESSSLLSSSWTPASSSLPLRSIVQACWATIQRNLLSATVTPSSLSFAKTENNTDPNRHELEQFVSGIVLLLPQTLANACYSAKVQVPLHGTPTHFYPRLIYFAWIQMQQSLDQPANQPSSLVNQDGCYTKETTVAFSELYAKVLIAHLLQTRRSDRVVEGLMQRFGETSSKGYSLEDEADDTNALENRNERVQESVRLSTFLATLGLTARDTATLILALLQHSHSQRCSFEHDKVVCEKDRVARSVCNSLFHSTSLEYQETIVEQLCFSAKASFSGVRDNVEGCAEQKQKSREKRQRQWSRWIAETITPVLDGSDDDIKMSVFSKRLSDIADRWSQITFVQEVEGRQQHHVSLVLWNGLIFLERSPGSLQDPGQQRLTGALVAGVSHRLGSILPMLRQDAMRIAQQLAKGLGQDGLRFDEFVDDDDSESIEEEQDFSPKDNMNNQKKKIAKTFDKHQSKNKTSDFLDPDADYDSDVEEEENEKVPDTKDGRQKPSSTAGLIYDTEDDVEGDDDDSVDWKDELIPYDLEDDEEDLRETPKPLHLLEALDLLRTGENHDHAFTRHEAALETLPSLIRTRPDNLADVAVSLALELLRMEDKFNIDKFNTKRETAIRALLVEEPLSVGQTLIEQLFGESGLSDRLSIIASLQGAAFELSGNKALIETSIGSTLSKNKRALVGQQGDDRSMLSPPNQVSRVLSKTRRKRSRGQNKIIRNNFSTVAPMWFYSLIAGFLKHKENETLWAGSTGSILLTYFFRCLATIVEFSGFQASQVLASDLLDLVWDFRSADVPEVRLSALVAVSTSIAMLSNEKLISLLFDDANLPKIMNEMSLRDPDKECRSLCQSISLSIRDVLNNKF